MDKKALYQSPETELFSISLEENLLGASTKGFTDDPEFDNSLWILG